MILFVYFRGVIKLFNAVTQHQKNVTTHSTSIAKTDKHLKSINKDMFLDILMKGSTPAKAKPIKEESEVCINLSYILYLL